MYVHNKIFLKVLKHTYSDHATKIRILDKYYLWRNTQGYYVYILELERGICTVLELWGPKKASNQV
jgi:hypothetical protein